MSWLNLEGKIIVVTGAASGIGREIATVFAENGSNVVVADISQKGQDIIDELPGGRARHLYIQTDITKRSSIEEMAKKTVTTYGKIDVLVNNAGINMPRLLVDPKDPGGKYELHEEEFDKMVAVNQKGPYLCTQIVVKEMIKKGISGVIINISSECGLEGSEGQSCYAAEYEEALAYTRGIELEELRKSYGKVSVPLGRAGKLREVANLVCFLASDKASYINGTTYNISGGKTRG